MTETRRPPTPMHSPVTPGDGAGDAASESFVRRAGRTLIVSIYGAMRVIRLYPPENEAVRNALNDLVEAGKTLLDHDKELELRTSGEFIFVNSTRLRLDLDNYASFSHLLSVLRKCGVGTVGVAASATARDWLVLLSQLMTLSASGEDITVHDVEEKLHVAGVLAFALGPPPVTDDDSDFMRRAKEAAKRTYSHSVAVTREVMGSVRMGQAPNLKKIKRVVQTIVDQILNEETSLVGLTTIRDYDEYTFTH